MRTRLIACLVVGCGGGSSPPVKDATAIDGPPRDAAIDAPPDAPTAVRRVACPQTADATVTTETSGPYAFVPPDLTISVGDIVMFSPRSLHNVVPHDSLPSDPGLNSGATGEVRCLQFTVAGEFNYQCSPHPVTTGIIRVQ